MAGTKRKFLTKKQNDFIVFIVDQRLTQKAAAEAVGINEATAWRWKQDKMFLDELEKASRNKFRSLGAMSIGVLESLMENAKDDNVKLKAALEANERAFGKVTSKIEASVTHTIEDILAAMNKGEGEADGESES